MTRRIAMLVLMALTAGCESERRVVATRGLLDGIPGAVSNLKVDADPSGEGSASGQDPAARSDGAWDSILRSFPGYQEPPEDARPVDGMGLRLMRPDGEIILILRSPGHVMHHLMVTLQNEEYDLLYDQVIAEAAKTEYRRVAQDPYESVQFLRKNRDHIGALFATFPLADRTPGVNMKPVGRNTFRMTAPKMMWPDLRLRSFDVIIEDGRFRLMSIR